MPTQINGLPAHALLVHAVVVLLPVASLLVIFAAWWPAARRRLGLATPILALASLALVPVTTHAGQWLLDKLPKTALNQRHADLGRGLLIWAIGLGVFGVVVYALGFVSDRQAAQVGSAQRVSVGAGAAAETQPAPAAPARSPMLAITLVVAVLATVVSVGTIVQVVRIGDSGAKAVWSGVK